MAGCGFTEHHRLPYTELRAFRAHVSSMGHSNGTTYGTFHFSLGVDNHSRVVFKVNEYTILSPPGFPLADDNRRHHCRVQELCLRVLNYVEPERLGSSAVVIPACNAKLSDGAILCCTAVPFFLKSGFPFLTEHMTMSPAAAAGSLFNLAPHPTVEMRYRFFAPELSAQLMTAPTGRASDIRNLFPDAPPRPLFEAMVPSLLC